MGQSRLCFGLGSYCDFPSNEFFFSMNLIDIFLWDFNRDGMGHTLSSYPSKDDFTVHSFLLKNFSNDSTYRPCPQPFHFATSSPQRLPKFDLKFSETCIFSINSTEAIKLTINRDNKTSFGVKVLLNRFFKNSVSISGFS